LSQAYARDGLGVRVLPPPRDSGDAGDDYELPHPVSARLSDGQYQWLTFITGQARITGGPLDRSTVIRHAIDAVRAAGDWAVHGEQLRDRHTAEPRRGPRPRRRT